MPTHLWLDEKRFGRMFVHKRRGTKGGIDRRSVKKGEKEEHLKRLISLQCAPDCLGLCGHTRLLLVSKRLLQYRNNDIIVEVQSEGGMPL